jgi:hypothetical protein
VRTPVGAGVSVCLWYGMLCGGDVGRAPVKEKRHRRSRKHRKDEGLQNARLYRVYKKRETCIREEKLRQRAKMLRRLQNANHPDLYAVQAQKCITEHTHTHTRTYRGSLLLKDMTAGTDALPHFLVDYSMMKLLLRFLVLLVCLFAQLLTTAGGWPKAQVTSKQHRLL